MRRCRSTAAAAPRWPRAGRVVAGMVLRLAAQQRSQIAHHRAGRARSSRSARGGADQAPQDAEGDQAGHRVAQGHVQQPQRSLSAVIHAPAKLSAVNQWKTRTGRSQTRIEWPATGPTRPGRQLNGGCGCGVHRNLLGRHRGCTRRSCGALDAGSLQVAARTSVVLARGTQAERLMRSWGGSSAHALVGARTCRGPDGERRRRRCVQGGVGAIVLRQVCPGPAATTLRASIPGGYAMWQDEHSCWYRGRHGTAAWRHRPAPQG